MIKRGLILSVIVAVLCTSSAVVAQPDRAVVPGDHTVLAGGHYQLTVTAGHTNRLVGGYRLRSYQPSVDPAPGCCCKTNLPCIVK